MPTAFAAFSELWIKDGSADARVEALTRAATAHKDDAGRIGWLIHRDLKAPQHLLSYELFSDAGAASQNGPDASTFDVRIPCSVIPIQTLRRRTAPADQPVAIFVYCRVEDLTAFASSMDQHIKTTLANESGCLAFAWHRDETKDDAVLLYELYASRDALSEHRRSAHLAAFRQRSEHLMLDARIHYASLVPGSPLEKINAFFGGGA